MIQVNYIAVLVCGVIAMVLGSLWYGPLFGKPWMKELGMSKGQMNQAMKKGMAKNYVIMFISSLLLAYVLAHVLGFASNDMGGTSVSNGLQGGFWMWLGFVATTMLGKVLWEGKSLKLYAIDSGYYLALILLMGVTLSVMS